MMLEDAISKIIEATTNNPKSEAEIAIDDTGADVIVYCDGVYVGSFDTMYYDIDVCVQMAIELINDL